MREVIKKDAELIKTKAKEILHINVLFIKRLGGHTNHTYKVLCDDNKFYVFRIPGEGTENLINRKDELVSSHIAEDLGIDAKCIYHESNGFRITEYIQGAKTLSTLVMKNFIPEIADIFSRLHGCNINTEIPFDVFDTASIYENEIKKYKVKLPDDYQEIKRKVLDIKLETDSNNDIFYVPCHNDPLCENWVKGDDKLYLIDWEYAGMNDPYWDLADVSIEACFTDAEDKFLLQKYLNHEPDDNEYKRFLANKIYVDYLWSLWALTRVPFDKETMMNWAIKRYHRLKDNLLIYSNR